MKTVTEKLDNGNTFIYKVIDGMSFHYKWIDKDGVEHHEETPDEVCKILLSYLHNGKRLKFYYGDPKTGRDWCEENYTIGTVGKSTGSVRIPLLIATSRSTGGGAILDQCILKIREVKTGIVLYQHPKYIPPTVEITPSDMPEYQFNTIVNGSIYGRHESLRSAQLCKNKLA